MTPIELIISDVNLDNSDRIVKQIAFIGQLDESNVDEQAKKVYELLETLPEKSALIFDYGELEYMNSRSIGYLTDWYSKMLEKQGKLVVVKARDNIEDILKVVGLTQIIEFYLSLDEAKLALVNM